MYECPNCAANLKYNIGLQALFCEHCDTTMNPYDFHKESDAEENDYFGVTVFSCPQCGGELMTEDTTAATFCSFCGSATILDSRISKEKRPEYIIPFRKDEEDCKKAYKKMMRRALFVPRELTDAEQIKRFRGIYMPYWVYSFDKKGEIVFDGKRSSRRGDYIITKHYDLTCDIDAEYNGLASDASSSFYDSLSEAIAPFDTRNHQPFHPAFLSGFYADTSDIDNSLYREDAREIVREDAAKKVLKKHIFFTYKKPSPSSLGNKLSFRLSSQELALFPVWFLSYQKDGRVAYAVVNGQTGRAAADLPVDPKKYLFGSILLAIPFFLLLNLFFTLKPTILLWIGFLLALFCTILANAQMTRIIEKESFEDDRGIMSKQKVSARDFQRKNTKRSQSSASRLGRSLLKAFGVVAATYFSTFVFIGALFLSMSTSNYAPLYIMGALFLFGMLLFCSPTLRQKVFQKKYYINWKRKLPYVIKPFIGIVIALIILLWNPVSDFFYYIGVIICMILVALTFTGIIECHNLLTTRKLPQLNKRGGDDNA